MGTFQVWRESVPVVAAINSSRSQRPLPAAAPTGRAGPPGLGRAAVSCFVCGNDLLKPRLYCVSQPGWLDPAAEIFNICNICVFGRRLSMRHMTPPPSPPPRQAQAIGPWGLLLSSHRNEVFHASLSDLLDQQCRPPPTPLPSISSRRPAETMCSGETDSLEV